MDRYQWRDVLFTDESRIALCMCRMEVKTSSQDVASEMPPVVLSQPPINGGLKNGMGCEIHGRKNRASRAG